MISYRETGIATRCQRQKIFSLTMKLLVTPPPRTYDSKFRTKMHNCSFGVLLVTATELTSPLSPCAPYLGNLMRKRRDTITSTPVGGANHPRPGHPSLSSYPQEKPMPFAFPISLEPFMDLFRSLLCTPLLPPESLIM